MCITYNSDMETRLGGDMFCVHTEVAMQHCGDEALLFQLTLHCPAQNAVLQIQCKYQQAAKQGSQVLWKVQGSRQLLCCILVSGELCCRDTHYDDVCQSTMRLVSPLIAGKINALELRTNMFAPKVCLLSQPFELGP